MPSPTSDTPRALLSWSSGKEPDASLQAGGERMQDSPARLSYLFLSPSLGGDADVRQKWTLDNPVITKELRGRMRGAKTYWLLFGYLLLLSLILFFSYLAWWPTHAVNMQTGATTAGFTVGRYFFKILFYAQAVMIALITPALTAGAISVEREQRTFEMLRSTILRPQSIVFGKLTASVSFVVLLLTSSLPLLSLCFLLGGVSPGEVFFAYLLLVGDAFLFGAIGLCWSAYAANTATATVLSYASLFVFFLVTFPFAVVGGLGAWFGGGGRSSSGLSALNPIGAVTAAVTPERYYGWIWPAWVPALLLNGALTALLVLACINRLEDFPARRAAPLRLVTLLFGGLLVFFIDGLMMAFAPIMGGGSSAIMLMLSLTAFAVALLFTPVLVTGDLADWARDARRLPFLWQSWTPRAVFGNATLPSGLPLALLLTALCLGLTYAAYHLGSPMTFVSPFFPMRGRGLPLTPAVSSPQINDVLLQAGLLLLAVVIGIAGLGFLLSVLLNNRWASLTLLYLGVTLGMALPYFTYGMLSGNDAPDYAHNPAINSLYLCPLVPLLQLSATLDPHIGNSYIFSYLAGYPLCPFWITTSILYLGFGLLCYALALTLLRRQRPNPALGRATLPSEGRVPT